MVVRIVESFKELQRCKNEVLLRESTAMRYYNDRGQWSTMSDAIEEAEDTVVDVMCRPRIAAMLATHFSTGDEYPLDGGGWDDMLETLLYWAKKGSVVITLYDVKIEQVRDYLIREKHATVG